MGFQQQQRTHDLKVEYEKVVRNETGSRVRSASDVVNLFAHLVEDIPADDQRMDRFLSYFEATCV